jgi:hypothetical protein
MTTTLESVADADRQLNEQVLHGNLRDAYERWYGDDVLMDENGHYSMKGKAANRDRQIAIGQLIRAYGRRLISSAVEGSRSFSEWEFDLEYGGVRYTLKQVSVREWENGKVVRERFYYHSGTSKQW